MILHDWISNLKTTQRKSVCGSHAMSSHAHCFLHLLSVDCGNWKLTLTFESTFSTLFARFRSNPTEHLLMGVHTTITTSESISITMKLQLFNRGRVFEALDLNNWMWMWRFRYVSSCVQVQNICHEVEGVFSELWECSNQKWDFIHAYYDQEKQLAPCVVLHSLLIMVLYNLKSMNMVVGNQLTVSLSG